LVVASFVPLAVKAIDYVTLGAFVPLIVLGICVGLVALGGLVGPRALVVTLGFWAAALVAWSVVRLGLIPLVLLVDIGEAHPSHQISLWYVLLSVALLLTGVTLWRWRA
jgi:hypothetical protein